MKHVLNLQYACPMCGHRATLPFSEVNKNVKNVFCPVCVPEDFSKEKPVEPFPTMFKHLDEPYIFMDVIGLQQIIETSFLEQEEVVFIPSGLQYPDPDSDIISACDECDKCKSCSQLDEEEREYRTYCSSFKPLCPNTCEHCTSSLTNKLQYLEKNHFSYEENWNLDTQIAKFVLSRLPEFRENICGYPSEFSEEKDGFEKWKRILRKIIIFCKLKIKDECTWTPEAERIENKTFRAKKANLYLEGLELFGKYFDNLWD